MPKEYFQEYRKKNPGFAYSAVKKWRVANKEKKNAHLSVWRAIKRGALKRLPCEVCGNEKSEAHHTDYKEQLNVRWLCRKHHKEGHI